MSQTSLLITATSLSGATIGLIFFVRHRDQFARDTNRPVYRLEFPPELTIDATTAFTRSLTALRPPAGWLLGRDSVVFESIRREGRTEQWLRVPERRADRVLTQLRGLVPGLRTTLLEQPNLPEMD